VLLSILALATASVVVTEASSEGVVDEAFREDNPQKSWLEETPIATQLLAQKTEGSEEVRALPCPGIFSLVCVCFPL